MEAEDAVGSRMPPDVFSAAETGRDPHSWKDLIKSEAGAERQNGENDVLQ